jgi:hypothetical protein
MNIRTFLKQQAEDDQRNEDLVKHDVQFFLQVERVLSMNDQDISDT